jgi:hypothetical protein
METLARWRDWVVARLIDDWRTAHKFWSVRLQALGALVMAGLGVVSTEFPNVWNGLPGDLREKAPSWLGTGLILCGLMLRLMKQKKPDA